MGESDSRRAPGRILVWIFLFPLMLSIWSFRTGRYVLGVVTILACILVGAIMPQSAYQGVPETLASPSDIGQREQQRRGDDAEQEDSERPATISEPEQSASAIPGTELEVSQPEGHGLASQQGDPRETNGAMCSIKPSQYDNCRGDIVLKVGWVIQTERIFQRARKILGDGYTFMLFSADASGFTGVWDGGRVIVTLTMKDATRVSSIDPVDDSPSNIGTRFYDWQYQNQDSPQIMMFLQHIPMMSGGNQESLYLTFPVSFEWDDVDSVAIGVGEPGFETVGDGSLGQKIYTTTLVMIQ